MTALSGVSSPSDEPVGRCRLCGGATSFALRATERQFGLEGTFDYDACEDCASLQIRRVPPSLERFYPADYYASDPSRVAVPSEASRARRAWTAFRVGPGATRRMLSGRRYARFEWFRRAGIGPDDAILDVGCGNGRLLRNLARDGFTDLTGIDPHWQGPAQVAPGLRFARATAAEWTGTHRLVMAHHSFEHAPDPAENLAAMADRMAPGGCLLLRVPLAGSWAAAHYGADWVQLDAPRHRVLPTRRGMAAVAERVGLRIVAEADDSGPFQIWGSEVLRRGVRLGEGGRGGRRVLGPKARWSARRKARALRRAERGDQACFWLVRST